MKYDNSFILFRNDKKDTDKHPDLTGKLTVNGQEYRIAAWSRTGEKGKFLTGKVDVEQREERRPAPAQEELNDDIPW